MTDFQIRFSGSGGQGLQLAAKVLAAALTRQGHYIAQSQSYEPTSRGGLSRADLVVSQGMVTYPLVTALDYCVLLDQVAVTDAVALIKSSTQTLVDSEKVTDLPKIFKHTLALPLLQSAREIGNARITNIVALGAINALGKLCSFDTVAQSLETIVPKRFLELNIEAFKKGYKLAESAIAASTTAMAN